MGCTCSGGDWIWNESGDDDDDEEIQRAVPKSANEYLKV